MPFLQQKGELDAEEQRKNELAADSLQRGFDSEEKYKLQAEEPRHELRSDEFAQELEVSEKP